MWCVPELNDEYIERMEDVLELYERPYRESEPVVCLDERPVQLHDEKRTGSRAKPGRCARYDYEYVRRGTANIFCAVEALAGRHLTKVTKNRKGPAFAAMLRDIAKRYPDADTIHLVMDNLSTHSISSLAKHFGEDLAHELWSRFTVHYTPKHGSWLNMTEIEIGLLNKQSLGTRRFPALQPLRQHVRAWNRRVNKDGIRIEWTFTRRKARKKFAYTPTKTKLSRH
jgi:hypothetical protein